MNRELLELMRKFETEASPSPERLVEAGTEVGRLIQSQSRPAIARRGNRRSGGLWRKSKDYFPASVAEMMARGSMRRLEYIAGERARDEAVLWTRKQWLPILEAWLVECELHPLERYWLERQIARLRRCLGVRKPPLNDDERRARGRERVARHRARKDTGA
jgi:hypothetical protein